MSASPSTVDRCVWSVLALAVFLSKQRANGELDHACSEGPPSLMIVSIAQTLEGPETCLDLSGTVESG